MRLSLWFRSPWTRGLLLGLLAGVSLLLALPGSGSATNSSRSVRTRAATTDVRAATTSSLGTHSPTFVGPAATGCAAGCQLLTGPFPTPSTASTSASKATGSAQPLPDRARALPAPTLGAHRRTALKAQ